MVHAHVISDYTSSPIDSHLGVCCLALSSVLGPRVSFPNTTAYHSSLTSYFTQQNSNLHPRCIVFPETAQDVSTAITTLTSTSQPHCPFAIRSGGHAYNTGFSNIQNGITIDLTSLNNITLTDDRETVSVGAGATWGDVYAVLEPIGLSVPGGRAAQVGVGGLALGGGISYFSPRYGWTCDSVSNFEIVLANGSIANANSKHNPDLRIALCGGGAANFGVVTRLDIRTFAQGDIWGGSVYYALDTIEGQLRAFEKLNSPEAYDDYASLITSFGFTGEQGPAIVNSIVYTKDEEFPAVYEPFFELPSLQSTVRIAPLSEIAAEQGSFSPDGKRQLSVVTTHDSTLPMLNATFHRWNASLPALQTIPGIVLALSLDPLPPSIYARFATENSMGLSETTGSYVVAQLTATWENEEDDQTVEETARLLFDGIERDARRLGAYNPYLYLNYAAEWQDPIASYGRESVERLRRVRREVDPAGVFRGMVPGGFKVPV
ncbi:FAD-binding oxidoreductase [Aspergillus lucknowensis]|uniref:FAD-binding PCMH-type domain-containing protein n=1 Tax=Aspergillus lucknowensis TaxID=176173 RepID=A0ABR4LLZ9_9EURO